MNFQPLIWKTHKRRLERNECPHCGKVLRWIYNGSTWFPCDKEPVLFMLHPKGKSHIVYNKELFTNALVYKAGDRNFEGVQPIQGNVLHYFTCSVLREKRREYVQIHCKEGK